MSGDEEKISIPYMDRANERIAEIECDLKAAVFSLKGGRAAEALAELLNDPWRKYSSLIALAAFRFDEGRNRSADAWRKEMKGANSEAQQAVKTMAALNETLFRLHRRMQEVPGLPTFSELALRNDGAFLAVCDLADVAAQMEAAAGPNTGGSPSDPSVAARMAFEREMTEIWQASGRKTDHVEGPILALILEAVYCEITGENTMPGSSNLLKRIRTIPLQEKSQA